jgi:uncharacterized membrane protein
MDNLTKSYFALSGIGMAVSIYHAYSEVTENFNACNISSSVSCGNVFASGYVSIFGVPFYVLGLIWFPLLLALGVWFTRGGKELMGDVLVPLLMVGNAFTIYLWYLELVRIGAICPVCVSIYIVNYVLTVLCLKIALR